MNISMTGDAPSAPLRLRSGYTLRVRAQVPGRWLSLRLASGGLVQMVPIAKAIGVGTARSLPLRDRDQGWGLKKRAE
ncbi:MAG: hypothetical protein AB2L17_04840 [Lentimicrobium sp.]|jgi:hypothetical protein